MTRSFLATLALLSTSTLAAPTLRITTLGRMIDNPKVQSGYRWIDAGDASTGLRLSRFKAHYRRAGIRINGDAHDIVIRDGSLTLRAPTKGSDLPVGVDLRGTVHDVLIDNVASTGNQMVSVSGKYTNGDGFSQERGVYGVTYRNDTATDNSDGGFDLKGKATLDNLTAERNGRNYRFWGDVTATRLVSVDPGNAHIWLNAKGPQTVVIDKLVARSSTTAPVLMIDNGFPVSVSIRACVLTVPTGTKLVLGGANAIVTLGQGCKLPPF